MGLVPMIPHNRVKLAVQYVSFAYNIEQTFNVLDNFNTYL